MAWAGVVPEERLRVGETGTALRVSYEVLLAVPGDSRGTGCIVGRSR
jgi:hypothetical protein